MMALALPKRSKYKAVHDGKLATYLLHRRLSYIADESQLSRAQSTHRFRQSGNQAASQYECTR